jgi:CheY-like chemotaxis protein
MIAALLIVSNEERWSGFAMELEGMDVEVLSASSGEGALSMTDGKHYDLLVMDETLPDMTGLELIERMVRKNPMLNCACVSTLSPSEFHEASEGLGVLMALPSPPAKDSAKKLIEHLKGIMGRIELPVEGVKRG